MNKPWITSIENLSNELFYEIFDYLDGIDLHEAFSNLNQHFQRLITAPCLRLKIKDNQTSRKDQYVNHWKQIIESHRHQICSVKFHGSKYDETFFTNEFPLNSSLDHLQSFHLWTSDVSTVMSVLVKLSSLPCLYSLSIEIEDPSMNLSEIYRLVFNLPMLKHYKFFTTELDLPVSLPMALDNQQTNIENLDVDHCCHLEELVTILSYTPKIRCLSFTDDSDEKLSDEILPLISLTNLTFLSINSSTLIFDQLESFIDQIRPHLRCLYFFNQSEDVNYLNAHRWERLIRDYLPELERFSFHYSEYMNDDHLLPMYPFQPNQFVSTFWIERKWLVEIQMTGNEIIYSIKPYEPIWYEYSRYTIVNCSMDFSKLSELAIFGMEHDPSSDWFIQEMKHVLTFAQIYHLDLSVHQLNFNKLIRILDLLPDIDLLRVRSILFDERIISSDEEQIFASVVAKNKISKIYLEKFKSFRDYIILSTLFPSMIYLKIDSIDINTFLSHLLCIFEQISNDTKSQLRFLSVRIPLVDDKLMKVFRTIFNNEEFFTGFTIERVLDRIYLQRK